MQWVCVSDSTGSCHLPLWCQLQLTHIQIHTNYFTRLSPLLTFERSPVCFYVQGLQQLSVKCQIPSASGIHKCLLYVVQREKKAKKVGEAAFTQEIRVFFEDKCQMLENSPRRCKNLQWKDHLPCKVLTVLMWKRWIKCKWRMGGNKRNGRQLSKKVKDV